MAGHWSLVLLRVLLKEVVPVFPRKEAGCFSCKAREAGNAEASEGKRERPKGRKKPEAGSHFPGRDAGDGKNGRVDRGVEGNEGGKIGLELRDASQVADAGENVLADNGKSRPAGLADHGWEGSGGLGGDGGDYPLAVLEGSGWTSQDYASVVVKRESSEAGGREDGPGGTRNRHLSIQREIPAAVKMLMVS